MSAEQLCKVWETVWEGLRDDSEQRQQVVQILN